MVGDKYIESVFRRAFQIQNAVLFVPLVKEQS